MRSVDAKELKPLKTRGFGPWRLDANRVLRTACRGMPLLTEADACRVFDTYRAAQDAGIEAPRPIEVVRVNEAYGVVVEYVKGLNLLCHLTFGSYTLHEAGEAMGMLLRQMHAHSSAEGRDLDAVYSERIRFLAPYVGSNIKEGLESLLEAYRGANSFLHGDFHLQNVVVRRGELVPIDLELAGFGHPIFDLAFARTRMLLNNHVPLQGEPLPKGGLRDAEWCESMRRLWQSMLSTYLGTVAPDVVCEVDKQTAVLAEVDYCCFKYEIEKMRGCGLTMRQQGRIDLCRRRLAMLLPQITRSPAW